MINILTSFYFRSGKCTQMRLVAYIMMKLWCSYVFQMSMALLAAFGKDTVGATWTVNFLLSKVESNLCSFSSEPALVKDTVRLFIALVDMREKYAQLARVIALQKIFFIIHNNF
jgi:hypothetical protein